MIISVLTSREEEDWRILLGRIQFAINSATTRSTKYTPYELFFGEKAPPLIKQNDLMDPHSSTEALKPLAWHSEEQMKNLIV